MERRQEAFAEYLSTKPVRLVKLSAVKKWWDDATKPVMKRYQELEADEYVQGGTPEMEAFIRDRGSRPIVNVSHFWAAKEHPDPQRTQMRAIVCERWERGVGDSEEPLSFWGGGWDYCGCNPVSRLRDDPLLFYDFSSVPQHDGMHEEFVDGVVLPSGHAALRTRDKQRDFKKLLKRMNIFYDLNVFRSIFDGGFSDGGFSEYNFQREWDCVFCGGVLLIKSTAGLESTYVESTEIHAVVQAPAGGQAGIETITWWKGATVAQETRPEERKITKTRAAVEARAVDASTQAHCLISETRLLKKVMLEGKALTVKETLYEACGWCGFESSLVALSHRFLMRPRNVMSLKEFQTHMETMAKWRFFALGQQRFLISANKAMLLLAV